MKRWALLTVLLYVATLLLLTVPVLLVTFGDWWGQQSGSVEAKSLLAIYEEPWFWTWIAVMGLGQALLLVVPVNISQRRLTPRRPLLVPVLTATFFLANIAFGIVLSVLCVLFRDKAFDAFGVLGEITWSDPVRNLVAAKAFAGSVGTGTATLDYILGAIVVLAGLWLFWGLVFYGFARADDSEAMVKRTVRWLLRGTILELLIAVPSHIVARRRDDCCAPLGTFWGITTGLSIMLLCLGPGVFFLFAERIRRLRAKQVAPAHDG
jgi:hypothetical protein